MSHRAMLAFACAPGFHACRQMYGCFSNRQKLDEDVADTHRFAVHPDRVRIRFRRSRRTTEVDGRR